MSILMRFPDGKAKTFTMSYDDGLYQDIRLVNIMSSYGLKGTFNLSSGYISKTDAKKGFEKLSVNQIKQLYIPNGHEVALHTVSHLPLTDLPIEHISYEFLKDKEIFENILGNIIRGSAYPYSKFNSNVLSAAKACGIAYARCGEQSENFEMPNDWLQIKPTIRHNNEKLFELTEHFINLSPRADQQCKMFYLMGHSFEFDNDNNWDVIENFTERISNHKDIWYATNIEIYDYVQAFHSIRYNLTKTLAENPTSTDIWILKQGKLYKLEAGKTTDIST